MPDLVPLRCKIQTADQPSVDAGRISRCSEHVAAWCATATPATTRERMKDLRRFGRWQWNEERPGVIVAWLLDLSAAEATDLIARFDQAEARTSPRASRKRRLHHIRGALKFAAARDGTTPPAIRSAVKDAA